VGAGPVAPVLAAALAVGFLETGCLPSYPTIVLVLEIRILAARFLAIGFLATGFRQPASGFLDPATGPVLATAAVLYTRAKPLAKPHIYQAYVRHMRGMCSTWTATAGPATQQWLEATVTSHKVGCTSTLPSYLTTGF
jgi:hypothetical protein